MRILGIDPGSIFCGYGVIDSNDKTLSVIEYGTIKVKKTEHFPLKMKEIYDKISAVINRTQPNIAAVETTFHSKNVQSLIKLTMARSAAILAVTNSNIEVNEYSAREIKRAVTGKGNASKEQVSFMVKVILNMTEKPEYYDTTDALAIAVCQANHIISNLNSNVTSNNSIHKNKKTTKKPSWEQYLLNNPNKIVKL